MNIAKKVIAAKTAHENFGQQNFRLMTFIDLSFQLFLDWTVATPIFLV